MNWEKFIGEIGLALLALFALWVIVLRPFAKPAPATVSAGAAPDVVSTGDQATFGVIDVDAELAPTNYLTVNNPNGTNSITAPGGTPEQNYLSSIDDYVRQMGPLVDSWASNVMSYVNG